MTLPTDNKQESRREVAETVATTAIENSAMESVLARVNFEVLVTTIETALKERDERAAKRIESLLEKQSFIAAVWYGVSAVRQQLTTLAAAIRNEDANG